MFAGKTIIQVFMMGGFTMVILIICSIMTLAIILERVFHFQKTMKLQRVPLMDQVNKSIEANDYPALETLCARNDGTLSRVVKAGLDKKGKGKRNIKKAMERQIRLEIVDLKKFTSVLGSIGSTVVYIGLFGTVLGIIRAFQDIALTANGAGGGMGMVITGIAEALVSTATGIFVAVPAVIAYNLIMKKVSLITNDMEIVASETSDLLRDKNEKQK